MCACSDDADEDGDAMWNMMMMMLIATCYYSYYSYYIVIVISCRRHVNAYHYSILIHMMHIYIYPKSYVLSDVRKLFG